MDPAKLDKFLGSVVGDIGATLHAAMVVIGDQRGLYKAMADSRPITASALAAATNCSERYVREWLNSQAAGGYVTYLPEAGTYALPPEHAAALADEDSPAYVVGGFYSALAALKATAAISQRFQTGEGLGWHEHDPWLFCGTERFFRPGYRAHLIREWLPALDGMHAKLEAGATVADIGCGHGASTTEMAARYPRSRFVGFDYHPESVAISRERAAAAGLSNATFEIAAAKNFPGKFDLVTMFDCLHDMGDPAGASAHIRQALQPDGILMLVEPYAEDAAEGNHNPLGRLLYSVSTLVCTPCSLSQEVGTALGAQAGEARLREMVTQGGFTRFRRAAQTPFNLVFEARP